MSHRRVFLPTRGIYPKETISSLLDRAGAIYGVGGAAFGQALLEKGASCRRWKVPQVQDWDDPPAEALEILADACGTTRQYLETLTIQDSREWIAPGFRTAYCPSCFRINLYYESPPYFRRDWAVVSRTFCYEHAWQQPLLNWSQHDPDGDAAPSASGRILPGEWVAKRLLTLSGDEQRRRRWKASAALCEDAGIPEESEEMVLRLTAWEQSLEGRLGYAAYLLGYYYAHNGGEPETAERSWGCPVFAPDGPAAKVASLGPQAGELRPSKDGWRWEPGITAAVPDEQMSVESAWEDFRRVGNPAARRAAFWLAACAEGEDLRKLTTDFPIFIRMAPFQGAQTNEKRLMAEHPPG